MKNYQFNVLVVGQPNLSGRFFEGVVTCGQYKGCGIDRPFIGAKIVDYRDPLDPFITEEETRWALNPGDEVIALVTGEDLSRNPVASFSWGPATSKIGKQLPFGKGKNAPASTSTKKGRSNNRKVTNTIFLPESGLRKSPLGHVSVIDIVEGRQAWCGPINPEKFPAALDNPEKYRYFAWTVLRDGTVSKVEICSPLDVEIVIITPVVAVSTKAPVIPVKAVAKVAPVEIVPIPVPAPTKVKGKKLNTNAVTDEPAPRKPAKGNRRQKGLRPDEVAELVEGGVLVKNSGPKVPSAPAKSPTAKAGEVVVPKCITAKIAEPSTVNPLFDKKDQRLYRVVDPESKKQLDLGKLADLVKRAGVLLADRKQAPTLADHVILEQEQGPGTGFFVRCERNVLKDGAQPMIEAIIESDKEDAVEASKKKITPPATAELATA